MACLTAAEWLAKKPRPGLLDWEGSLGKSLSYLPFFVRRWAGTVPAGIQYCEGKRWQFPPGLGGEVGARIIGPHQVMRLSGLITCMRVVVAAHRSKGGRTHNEWGRVSCNSQKWKAVMARV